MALALNNLKRVDMPLNKETKPNQTMECELTYYNVAVQHISHYTSETRSFASIKYIYLFVMFLYVSTFLLNMLYLSYINSFHFFTYKMSLFFNIFTEYIFMLL